MALVARRSGRQAAQLCWHGPAHCAAKIWYETATRRRRVESHIAESRLAREDSIRRHAAEQPIPQDQRVKQNRSEMGDEGEE
jgi:hypothetical protein